MILKTLKFEMIENKEEKWLENASTINREKRERVLDKSIELFCVFFELSRVLYLYRDFVTEFS